MKWTSKDISQYVQAKEYIDTVIIPLMPISFGENIKTIASHGEYINILSYELERQFKGRVILLPPFSYVETDQAEKKVEQLNNLSLHIKENNIKHVFLMTSDSSWSQNEQQLEGKLVWLPAIPLEDMEDKYKQKIIQDQMNQLLPMFIQKWQD
ncbi:YpiF family protein [Sutcliffiella horikoshii]|uniref:YpiF family protein n=1 Tax=Sutcliffiella horikoshii TaxID=79883 RepID=UPI001CBF45A4|nr:YpiF family protein [Sutcliffiella horikoshii]UAL45754.1 YpiF family protein [Sutcliffiella horikoshii]